MPSAAAGAIPRGDTDNNERVNIMDLALLLQWLGGFGGEVCTLAADVDASGKVDYTDISALVTLLFRSEEGSGEGEALEPATVESCEDLTQPLLITGEQALSLTPDSALVSWLTPHPASTTVRFGPDGAPQDRVVTVPETALFHQALLPGLEPGKKYRCQVESALADKSEIESKELTFETLPDKEFSIRKDHPRIFFTAKELPRLRRKVAEDGTHYAYWRKLVQYCSANLDTPLADLALDDSAVDRLRGFAFAGLIGEDEKFRNKALDLALYLAKRADESDLRDSTEAMAYVYDWLYEHLPEKTRSTLYGQILAHCLALERKSRDDEFVTGLSHGNHKSMALGTLAVYDGNQPTERLVRRIYENYRYGFLATWRRFAGQDGGSSKGWWYTTHVLPFELEFFAAWRSATAQDLFETERVWCEGVLDWFVYGLRGDGTFLREGDTRIYYGLNHQNRMHGLLAASEYGNSTAQWLALAAGDVATVWGPKYIQDILWYDPSVEPEPPSGPTSKLFRNVGVVVMRESWKSDAAIASFRSAEVYTLGHTHRDNCSFTLYYKGDLAVDSGIYDGFDTKHHDNYYSRTIAHNAITVFDPEEVFSKYGEVHVNDGGQRWLTPGKEVPHAWPPSVEDTINRESGYRQGGIVRYEDGEDFTYTVGDAGPAYSPSKLKRFHRHFLWLKHSTDWPHPVAVVFDDVNAVRGSYKKTYLLHTLEKPVVRGNLLEASAEKGVLYQFTLEPKDATLELVGGKGKEFWVDGKNYPPDRGAQEKEYPGSWRLEVSPAEEATVDRFLNVLYPGDADMTAPRAPKPLTVGTLHGCRIGYWTVLFDTGKPVVDAQYESVGKRSLHLIFGAVPFAAYEVYLNGDYSTTVQATFSGTLRFDVTTAGTVRVARRAE